VKDPYDIHLPPYRFAGQVVDDAGLPVAGASVYACTADWGADLAAAVTDTGGRFRFNIDYRMNIFGVRVQVEIPAEVYVQAVAADGYSKQAGPFRTKEQTETSCCA